MTSGGHFAANARCADQDIETNSFGCFQEPSILQSRQISEASGLALVTGEQTRQSAAASDARQQELLSFLKGFNGQGAGNGWETFQKILQRIATLQIVE